MTWHTDSAAYLQCVEDIEKVGHEDCSFVHDKHAQNPRDAEQTGQQNAAFGPVPEKEPDSLNIPVGSSY